MDISLSKTLQENYSSPNLGIHMYDHANTGVCLFKEYSPLPK